jgi:hypothetical protein
MDSILTVIGEFILWVVFIGGIIVSAMAINDTIEIYKYIDRKLKTMILLLIVDLLIISCTLYLGIIFAGFY